MYQLLVSAPFSQIKKQYLSLLKLHVPVSGTRTCMFPIPQTFDTYLWFKSETQSLQRNSKPCALPKRDLTGKCPLTLVFKILVKVFDENWILILLQWEFARKPGVSIETLLHTLCYKKLSRSEQKVFKKWEDPFYLHTKLLLYLWYEQSN